MAIRAGLFCFLLVSSMLLAGCQEIENSPFGRNDPDGSHEDDGPGGQDVDERVDGGSARLRDEAGSCLDHDPPEAAHPDAQWVESPSDLECPGQISVVDQGEGQIWEVPEWSVGDWWRYRVETHGPTIDCQIDFENELIGPGNHNEVAVYRLESITYECSGDLIEATQDNVTVESLSGIHEDGFVTHDVRFPLREGKNWQWVDRADGGTERIHVEATFMDDYLFEGEPVAAWHVVSTGPEAIREQWWGTHAQALLYEEHRTPGGHLLLSVRLIGSGS